MGRVVDWFKHKVRDPLLAELKQGATPEDFAAATTVSLAIAVNPFIGTTTILCLLAGKIFRLNHVVMQTINYFSYPLQLVLIVPFIRLGEKVTGAEPFPIHLDDLIAQFRESIPGFFTKFGIAGWHALIGYLIVVPISAWIFNFFLKKIFRKILKPKSPTL